VGLYFFQKKKEKVFVPESPNKCGVQMGATTQPQRQRYSTGFFPVPGKARPMIIRGFHQIIAFFFSRKEAKALVLLRRKQFYNSAKPTLGVWGLAPKETINRMALFFTRKEAKESSSARTQGLRVSWLG
jgi:hypothetical protein